MVDSLKQQLFDTSFDKQMRKLEEKYTNCYDWFTQSLQDLELQLRMANQDIQTKNIILKDKEKAFSELKSGEEDVFQVTRKNEDLQLRIRNLDSITKSRNDELMNAKLTIQDMTAELDTQQKSNKALQVEIERLQKEIERNENEVADLNYRLQEANDQCN